MQWQRPPQPVAARAAGGDGAPEVSWWSRWRAVSGRWQRGPKEHRPSAGAAGASAAAQGRRWPKEPEKEAAETVAVLAA